MDEAPSNVVDLAAARSERGPVPVVDLLRTIIEQIEAGNIDPASAVVVVRHSNRDIDIFDNSDDVVPVLGLLDVAKFMLLGGG